MYKDAREDLFGELFKFGKDGALQVRRVRNLVGRGMLGVAK